MGEVPFEAEANSDYDDWLREVDRAVDALANALRTTDEVLTPGDFVPLVLARSFDDEPHGAETPLSLAAASTGALARLYDDLVSREGPPARRIDLVYPGEVVMTLEAGGVAVVYAREGDQCPPDVYEIDGDGLEQRAQWSSSPAGTASRTVIPWHDGRVTLRFGHGPGAREVTIRQ